MADQQKSWLQQQITPQNIIAIATVLISLGAMWASVQSSNAEQDRRISAAESDIKAARSDTSTILQAIAELRTDVKYLSRQVEQKGMPTNEH